MKINDWKNHIQSTNSRIAIPIMTHPGIELCNKTVRDAVTSGNVHAEAIIKLNDIYPAAASTTIMDLTVEAEAFGAEVIFPEDEVPSVSEVLINSTQAIDALEIPTLHKGRIQEYLKANQLAVAKIQDKPVFAGCIGPFSLAGRLFGMTELMIAIYTEPESVLTLLKKCTTFLREYCQAIKQTGVAGVIMAEPAAGLISNDDCELYSSNFIKTIVDELQDDSFMLVLHNCGNTGHSTQAMIKTGANALHFGNKIKMRDALKECPTNILVMGNIDPVCLFKQATAQEVYKATYTLLEEAKEYSNFILSSGCDIPPHTPKENIQAFYRALSDYNSIHSK